MSDYPNSNGYNDVYKDIAATLNGNNPDNTNMQTGRFTANNQETGNGMSIDQYVMDNVSSQQN